MAEPAAVERARALLGAGVLVLPGDGRVVRVPTDGTADHLRHVLDTLAAGGVAVSTATVHRPTLDDVFLSLTGTRQLEGAAR